MTRTRGYTGTCLALAISGLLLAGSPAGAEDTRRPATLNGITGATAPSPQPRLDLEADLRELTSAAESASALGVYHDAATAEYVVVAPAGGASAGLAVASSRRPDLPVRVEHSRLTRARIDAVTRRIAGRGWHPEAARYSYASYFDVERDRVVLDSDAPARVIAPLLAEHGAAIDHRRTSVGRQSRYADPLPHWGGSALVPRSAWDADHNAPLRCTTAFGVRTHNTSQGFDSTLDLMLTAGHCAELTIAGWEVYNWNPDPLKVSGYANMLYQAPAPAYDMALLGNLALPFAWDGVIYTGGGNDENGLLVGPTAAAADPVAGATGYCYSGAATFENCGQKIFSTSAQLCVPAGCTTNLVAYRPPNISAPLPALPGDSGAPLYQHGECVFDGSFFPCALARGMHIAASGRMMLAVKWSTVASGGPFRGIAQPTPFNFSFISLINYFGP